MKMNLRLSRRLALLGLLTTFLCWPLLSTGRADRISALAPKPDWSELERFQQTITRAEFLHLLNTIYAPGGTWRKTISIGEKEATIRSANGKRVLFRLTFAPDKASARPLPRYWKERGTPKPGQPLHGLKIAIDPGHIGGRWAKMEERWFQIGNTKPVMEGEMVLVVARHLSRRLEALGAEVAFIRNRTEPVTRVRPKDLRSVARAELKRQGIRKIRSGYNGPADPLKMNSLDWQSEILFYRTSEIRTRARLVNEKIQPDVTLCLHFNAEAWGDPAKPQLTDKNHLHLLVNGAYGAGELAIEDMRHDMLVKLLNRSARVELPLSDAVAGTLAKATGLPPYVYHNHARRVTPSPYVWARNLLANRLYHGPVVFCEPYVMNSHEVFAHVQQGDYEGVRSINGRPRKSIYREYADAVAEGVAAYFSR